MVHQEGPLLRKAERTGVPASRMRRGLNPWRRYALVSETIPDQAQDIGIPHRLNRPFLLLTRYSAGPVMISGSAP